MKTTENSHLLKGTRLEGSKVGNHHQESNLPNSNKNSCEGEDRKKNFQAAVCYSTNR